MLCGSWRELFLPTPLKSYDYPTSLRRIAGWHCPCLFSGMINPERYIGKVILFRNGEHLPTHFFMQYRNGRFSYVAETEILTCPGKPRHGRKIVSSADRLIELIRAHRQNVESFAVRS